MIKNIILPPTECISHTDIFHPALSGSYYPHLDKIRQILVQMELPEFEEIINQVAYFADKLKDEFSSELLKNRLNELPEQQEIWLPYGDSINICLKKTSNSYFEITVINIGESPYHPRIILNGALTVSLELN